MELSQLIRLIQHVVQIAPADFATTRASRAVKLGILISQERELRRDRWPVEGFSASFSISPFCNFFFQINVFFCDDVTNVTTKTRINFDFN